MPASDNRLEVRFVADTEAKRRTGLMHAAPLRETEAVLFIFPYAERYAFWNKNVSFDLSLAFLDEAGQVVDLADMEAQSTESVAPCREARFVVEAKRGAFEKLDVREGDLIQYQDNALRITRIGRRA